MTKSKESLKRIWDKFPWENLRGPVIGVDEVGRGCLAGRVYAAAVILDPKKDNTLFRDSKLVVESQREELADWIKMECAYGVGFATVEEIDSLNILHASLLAMKRAVEALRVQGGHILVDGNKEIPNLMSFEQTTLVKGDQRAAPISAASILAKVERDHYMRGLGVKYPEYGFNEHKAYATKIHREAIEKYGPTTEHRKYFAGVKEHWHMLRQP